MPQHIVPQIKGSPGRELHVTARYLYRWLELMMDFN